MDKRKSFLDDISEKKPESFQEEVFVPAQKRPGRLIWTGTGILLLIIAVLLIMQSGRAAVPDMSGWEFEDVQTWSVKKHENTVINGVYSKEIAVQKVISQDIKAGQKISKNKVLTVTYSLGADPEEAVILPDIKSMKLFELKSFISENQMSGITIKYETSEVIPKDQVISYEYVDGSGEEFLRKNRMIIYVSSGNEDLGTPVKMPDFYGKTRADVVQWEEDNQMKVTIHEVFNADIEYGKVFNQSIKKDTKITRKDSVEISISRGKAIQVPDFTGMTRTEASELAALYGMSVFFKLEVNNAGIDTVISQDIKAGTEIDQKQILTIKIAKEEGKILVPDFKGLSKAEANGLAGLYGIKVFLRGGDEVGEEGIIASQTIPAGTKVNTDQIITLVLKDGKEMVVLPDFTGKAKSEAEILAKDLNIILSYREVENAMAANQTIIGQGVKPKRRVAAGETILLSVAVNSGIRAESMWKLSLDDAKAWAMKNGITLNVIDHYNGNYSVGKLFRQDCPAGNYISSGKTLSVYRSLGLVMIDNFIGKTKSELLRWKEEVNQKGAHIDLNFIADTDTKRAKGVITKQSIVEELVEIDQLIDVWVSETDKGVLIKNFDGLVAEDLKLWCETNGVPYIISECYNDSYEEGLLYGQNYKGTYLPGGENLKINVSLGKVFAKDFTGMSKSEMVDWQKEVNKKKAHIELEFTYWYSSDIPKGKIIDQTVKDQEVELNTKIIVTVSLGAD